MKITIVAIGSHGDILPMVALGQGLQTAGHQVCIATHDTAETLVRQHGLDFCLVHFDMKQVFNSEAGKAGLESKNPISSIRNLARVVNPLLFQLGFDYWTACQGAEMVIHTNVGCYFAASLIEQRTDARHLFAFLQPKHPTRAFPSFLSPTQRQLGGFLNRATQFFHDATLWWPHRTAINDWRQQQFKSPPLGWNHFQQCRALRLPTLYGFSPHLLPKPADWGDHLNITGYWHLNESEHWQPPPDLVNFLAAGPPPVYFGFGSMTTSNPAATAEIILQALTRTQQRGILLTGWAGLDALELPDTVFKIDYAPFDWLFPQMAAVVHHGGTGTLHAGLRAGVPTLIIPFFFDQPFWGQRIAESGLGPPPIPRHQLSVERLATAIQMAGTDETMRHRASALGKLVQSETGVRRAVELVNHYSTT